MEKLTEYIKGLFVKKDKYITDTPVIKIYDSKKVLKYFMKQINSNPLLIKLMNNDNEWNLIFIKNKDKISFSIYREKENKIWKYKITSIHIMKNDFWIIYKPENKEYKFRLWNNNMDYESDFNNFLENWIKRFETLNNLLKTFNYKIVDDLLKEPYSITGNKIKI